MWRVEPGEGPAPPRNLPHCPVSPALHCAGHRAARPHPHLPSGPSSQECPGWGLWEGSSCWHLLARLAEEGPWPTDALDMFWCPGLGVSRRGFISNQDHLSRVNCLHHGLVARQGMVPLGPPKPEAPKNRGQRPIYEKGLSVPDRQGWATVGVVSSWLCR